MHTVAFILALIRSSPKKSALGAHVTKHFLFFCSFVRFILVVLALLSTCLLTVVVVDRVMNQVQEAPHPGAIVCARVI